jgi:hypothetical protein
MPHEQFKEVLVKRNLILISFLVLVFTSSCCSPDKVKPLTVEKAPLSPLTEQEKDLLNKMGGEVLADNNIKIGNIIIHRKEKELSFPAEMCITDGGEYGIEALISLPHGRIHEALMVTEIDPVTLQLALYLIGAANGTRIQTTGANKQGTLITIDVKPKDGERTPVEEWLYDIKTKELPPRSKWVFVGSSFKGKKCLAKEEGNVVNFLLRGSTILDSCSELVNSNKGLGVKKSLVPGSGSPVIVYFSIAKELDGELD